MAGPIWRRAAAGRPPAAAGAAWAWARDRLRGAGVVAAEIEARVLVALARGGTPRGPADDIAFLRQGALASDEVEALARLVRDRVRRRPLQYIAGGCEFRGLDFHVRDGAFVPRPDTEALVEAVLDRLDDGLDPRRQALVADVGTGVGVIAVTVAAARPNCRVVASDVSRRALAVARANALRHGVGDRVAFVRGDLLAPVRRWLRRRGGAGGPALLDVVASNPPYIPSRDIAGLMPEVARFEPRRALDGGRDGLGFYRRLGGEASSLLKPGGVLAVEVGCGQATAVAAILRRAATWDRLEVRCDLAAVERVVVCRLAGGDGRGAGGAGEGV